MMKFKGDSRLQAVEKGSIPPFSHPIFITYLNTAFAEADVSKGIHMNAATLFLQNLASLMIKDRSFLQPYVDLAAFPSLFSTDKTNEHHVLPVSLAIDLGITKKDYDDKTTNIVTLEIADHVLAHYYLHKLLGGKMTYAFHRFTKSIHGWEKLFSNKKNRIQIVAEIAKSIKDFQEYVSKTRKGKKLNLKYPKKGIPQGPMSEESKRKMSEAAKNRPEGYYNARVELMQKAWKGRRHSEESRKKISKAKLGKKNRPASFEQKEKIRESMQGRVVLTNGIKKRYVFKNSEIYQKLLNADWRLLSPSSHVSQGVLLSCPWCGKQGKAPGILGYHFNFCKSNPARKKRKDNIRATKQKAKGNLSSSDAAKAAGLSVPHFVRLGKLLFPNKIIFQGSITFWTEIEVQQIQNYKKLSLKERSELRRQEFGESNNGEI